MLGGAVLDDCHGADIRRARAPRGRSGHSRILSSWRCPGAARAPTACRYS